MTPFLILGLALVATSAVLMLRSFALASSERRRTLDQISAYGFHSAAVAEESADLRASFGDLAEATGEKALARFDRLRSGERGLRELLDSAGMYGTSVARFVGSRILAPCRPRAAVPHVARRSPRLPAAPGRRTDDVMGWYLPYVRVQRRARLRSSRSIARSRARRPARDDGGRRRRVRGGPPARLPQHRGPAGPGAAARAPRAEPRPHTGGDAAQPLRVDSPATRAFTQALVQGESLGVSIGTILRDLAIDMRKRRRQSAEERAQKTPTKILFP